MWKRIKNKADPFWIEYSNEVTRFRGSRRGKIKLRVWESGSGAIHMSAISGDGIRATGLVMDDGIDYAKRVAQEWGRSIRLKPLRRRKYLPDRSVCSGRAC